MTLKRFLLFAGATYYASGGWKDFVGSFDTQTEAEAAMRAEGAQRGIEERWAHVVDIETAERVADIGDGGY